jgi:hypothetical protein
MDFKVPEKPLEALPSYDITGAISGGSGRTTPRSRGNSPSMAALGSMKAMTPRGMERAPARGMLGGPPAPPGAPPPGGMPRRPPAPLGGPVAPGGVPMTPPLSPSMAGGPRPPPIGGFPNQEGSHNAPAPPSESDFDKSSEFDCESEIDREESLVSSSDSSSGPGDSSSGRGDNTLRSRRHSQIHYSTAATLPMAAGIKCSSVTAGTNNDNSNANTSSNATTSNTRSKKTVSTAAIISESNLHRMPPPPFARPPPLGEFPGGPGGPPSGPPSNLNSLIVARWFPETIINVCY